VLSFPTKDTSMIRMVLRQMIEPIHRREIFALVLLTTANLNLAAPQETAPAIGTNVAQELASELSNVTTTTTTTTGGVTTITTSPRTNAVSAQESASLKNKAEKGDAESQFRLGRMYDEGDGITKDLSEAVKWYRKAAEQGSLEAQVALGDLYSRPLRAYP
jgi:hypothetical protein